MKPELTQNDIAAGLRDLGLKDGDVVLLHSSLASIGRVGGGADAVIDAFLAVIGASGTLVVPTFGALGIITEVLKARPDAVQSILPKACVAALGAQAKVLCRDHWQAELAHGQDTPYTRIAEVGGYVCLLGVDQDRNTTLHTVEELARLPYLKTTAPITFDTPAGEVTKSWPFFPGPHRDFIGLDPLLLRDGEMRIGRIGDAMVRLMPAQTILDVGAQAAKDDPAFALCDNPNCADCEGQRAALRRDRFARESFQLAAAASLAGRYAEEIAENCQRAGITAVELDCLNGKPATTLGAAKVERAVALLREEGIEVAALRLPCVPKELGSAIELAGRIGVNRIVMPLSPNASQHVAACQAAGITVSFGNSILDCEAATEIVLELEGAGLAFSPAAFARAGEKPFLQSYRRKLRHSIDQLDIEDATFDGIPQPLAQGNGEIKELVSILRCRSFSGWFVLSATNRAIGSLQDAVGQLERVLDQI